jgi:hypothetical protein
MFTSTQEYLQRITHSLEHVIAPQIESDYLRGQLLAAVFLLDQLTDRVDYRVDLLTQEVEGSCEMIRRIVEALDERGGEVPGDLRAFASEIDQGNRGTDLAFRRRCDETLCSAIDAFFASRDKFDPASARTVDGLVLGHLAQIAARDLGMYKPSTSEKLLDFKTKA